MVNPIGHGGRTEYNRPIFRGGPFDASIELIDELFEGNDCLELLMGDYIIKTDENGKIKIYTSVGDQEIEVDNDTVQGILIEVFGEIGAPEIITDILSELSERDLTEQSIDLKLLFDEVIKSGDDPCEAAREAIDKLFKQTPAQDQTKTITEINYEPRPIEPSLGNWSMPIDPPYRISGDWHEKRPATSGGTSSRLHNGIDIAAPRGTPVSAAASGRVIFAGMKRDYGNVVYIDCGNGLQAIYAHLDSINEDISVGSQVEAGQVVGVVGSTGRSTGPHLHFQVNLYNTPIDPSRLISSLR